MKNKKALFIVQAATIAALYTVLTYVSSLLGLSSGVIQVRFSEALTILPAFTPAAIPGLFVGCIISNAISGAVLWDIIFGSIATLLGAIFTYMLRRYKWLTPIPPIVANTLIVPPILIFAYGATDAYLFIVATVCAGEVISCGILGLALYHALDNKYCRGLLCGIQN